MSTTDKFTKIVNNSVTQTGTDILDASGDNFKDAGKNLENGKPFSAFANGIDGILSGAAGSAVTIGGAVGGAVVGTVAGAGGLALKGAKATGQALSAAGEDIGDASGKAAQATSNFGDKRIDAADKALNDAKDAVGNMDKKPITGLFSAVTNTLDAGVNTIAALPGKTVDAAYGIGNLGSNDEVAKKAANFDADMAKLIAAAKARNATKDTQAQGTHIDNGTTVTPLSGISNGGKGAEISM